MRMIATPLACLPASAIFAMLLLTAPAADPTRSRVYALSDCTLEVILKCKMSQAIYGSPGP